MPPNVTKQVGSRTRARVSWLTDQQNAQVSRLLYFLIRVIFWVSEITISLLGLKWYLRRNQHCIASVLFSPYILYCCLLCLCVLGWYEGRKTKMIDFWPPGVDGLVKGGRWATTSKNLNSRLCYLLTGSVWASHARLGLGFPAARWKD